MNHGIFFTFLICLTAHAQTDKGPLESLNMQALDKQICDLELQSPIQTNWYVLAGAPCTGKSELLMELAWRGHAIRPEAARVLLAEEKSRGRSYEQSFSLKDESGQSVFSYAVLQAKLDAEAKAPVDQLIFWDRSLPDSVAIRRNPNRDISIFLRAQNHRRYKGVFLLEPPVEFENDGLRTEDATEAQRQQQAIVQCYTTFGYNLIHVPKMTVRERADFILQKISEN